MAKGIPLPPDTFERYQRALEALEKTFDTQLDTIERLRVSNERRNVEEKVRLRIEQQRAAAHLDRSLRIETGRQRGSAIGSAIGGLVGAGNMGGAIGGGLGAGIAALAGPVGMAVEGVKAFTGAVENFVQKASPGAMERFQLILDDVTAVIGQTLVPVLEVLGQGLRLIGDFLKTILPSADELREALAPLREAFESVREVLAQIAPFIHEVLLVALKAFAIALEIATFPIKLFAAILEGLFGKAKPLKSSEGTAARGIHFTTQEAASREIYQAAFKNSGGMTEPQKQTGWLEKIHKALGVITDFVRALAEHFLDAEEMSFGLAAGAATGGGGKGGGLEGGPIGQEAAVEAGMDAIEAKAAAVNKAIDEGRFFRPIGAGKDAAGDERRRQIDEMKRRALEQGVRRGVDGHPGGGGF